MAELDGWLTNGDGPKFGLMAAEAGRGKSAVLVRWAASLVESGAYNVVYFPISLRFRTTKENDIYHAIASRFFELYGEKPPSGKGHQWRDYAINLLKRHHEDARQPIVLIIDGLDEGIWEQEPGPDFFPQQIGDHVRILVSARYKVGDIDAQGWLQRLGWDRSGVAHQFDLPPLERDGIKDVLAKMGGDLDKISANFDILERLYALTERGDPLLLHLFVDALSHQKKDPGDLTPDDLLGMEIGLNGFFKKWWENQEEWWEQRGEYPLDDAAVELFFNLCSIALGPLSLDDLRELDDHFFGSQRKTNRLVTQLNRFIIGDGQEQGFVFAHPKLAYHFQDQLSPRERIGLEDRFLKFGSSAVASFNAELVDNPEDQRLQQYRYPLNHYANHLNRAFKNRPNVSQRPERNRLLSEGWLRAQVVVNHDRHDEFLRDVDLVWRWAKRDRFDLKTELICTLAHSSVVSLSHRMSPNLLSALLEYGLIQPQQAFTYFDLATDEIHKRGLLIALTHSLEPIWFGEIIARLSQIEKPQERGYVLDDLIPLLDPNDQYLMAKITRHTLDCWWYPHAGRWDRPSVLDCLLEKFPELRHSKFLNQLMTFAREIRDSEKRDAIFALAKYLGEDELLVALGIADTINNEKNRGFLLGDLAPFFREKHYSQAIDIIDRIQHPVGRSVALANLIENISPQHLPKLLAMTQSIPDEEWSLYMLWRIVPILSDGHLEDALERARGIKSIHYRATSLAEISKKFGSKKSLEILEEAFNAAQKIPNSKDQINVLISLIPLLKDPLLSKVLDSALFKLDCIDDVTEKIDVFVNLGKHLDEQYLKKGIKIALSAAALYSHAYYRMEAYIKLLPLLKGNELNNIAKFIFEEFKLNISSHKNYEIQLDILIDKIEFQPLFISKVFEIACQLDIDARIYFFKRIIEELDEGSKDVIAKDLIQYVKYSTRGIFYYSSILEHLGSRINRSDIESALATRFELTNLVPDQTIRAGLYFDLVNILDERQIGVAIKFLFQNIDYIEPDKKAELIISFLPYIQDDQLDQVLEIAALLDSKRGIRELLTKIVARLKGHQREYLLSIWSNNLDKFDQIKVAESIAPFLTKDQIDQVFDLICSIKTEDYLTFGLATIAPYLNKTSVESVVSITKKLEDPNHRSMVLFACLPNLKGELKSKIFETALLGSKSCEPGIYRHKVVIKAIPHLEDKFQRDAINLILYHLAGSIGLFEKQERLIEIAPFLNSDQVNQALNIVEESMSPSHDEAGAEVLEVLAPKLIKDQMEQALSMSLKKGDIYLKPYALLRLKPFINEERFIKESVRAFDLIMQIQVQIQRAIVLIDFISVFSGNHFLKARSEAFNTFLNFEKGDTILVEKLIDLMPYLEPESRGLALKKAIDFIKDIEEENYPGRAITIVLPHCSSDQVSELFELIFSYRSVEQKIGVLGIISGYLNNKQIGRALNFVYALNEKNRLEGVKKLAPILKGVDLSDAFKFAKEIDSPTERAEALLNLIKQMIKLGNYGKEDIRLEFRVLCETWASMERGKVLTAMEESIELLEAVAEDGESAHHDFAETMFIVSDWWP